MPSLIQSMMAPPPVTPASHSLALPNIDRLSAVAMVREPSSFNSSAVMSFRAGDTGRLTASAIAARVASSYVPVTGRPSWA